MRTNLAVWVITVAASILATARLNAGLLKQIGNDDPVQPMTTVELSELGDPFFLLVLKENAEALRLSEVEQLLQPEPRERQTFVVHEDIVDDRIDRARRSVIAFKGLKNGIVLTANVMLSVFFDSSSFPDEPSALEAWGWDEQRGRYNYYKLDNTGTTGQGKTWKFRGSSVGADQLTVPQRRNTCFACHINGSPVMKELLRPWNNWHSVVSGAPANYLIAGNVNAWPVASDRQLKGSDGGGLTDAFQLEESILAALHGFNARRIEAAIEQSSSDNNAHHTIRSGQRLLRPLFQTTEYNLISSTRASGLHALPQLNRMGPSGPVPIPDSFFLNAELIAGGGQSPGYRGLGVPEAKSFGNVAQVKADEYKSLVLNSKVRLHGEISDANFAWLAPQPSHVDNDLIDQLLQRGVVSPSFVAAILAVDLENPVLSADRANLLHFVPERFDFAPASAGGGGSPHPDDVTRKTIESLRAANVSAVSAAGEWLALLEDADPVARLQEQVKAYKERIQHRLDDPQQRTTELKRLFELLIERRKAVNAHPVLGALDETGGRRLLPVPTGD